MTKYNVTGMSCAACQSTVEKAVGKVDGVTSVAVSLLTNSMNVEGNVDTNKVIDAVVKAGYGATLAGDNKTSSTTNDQLEDKTTKQMVKRLIASLIFWLPLMYITMGWMMWGWPLPTILTKNHLAIGIIELLLTIIIMVINQKFFISGYKALFNRHPNMDSLIAVGSSASFLYSVYALLAMSYAVMDMDMTLAMVYMDEFYFESAATILTLITIGKTLESYSKGKTTNALKSLIKLSPKSANIEKNGTIVNVPIEQVQVKDIFIVKPGEAIACDGIVISGSSAVNESALTGESIPVDKNEGDSVSAGTLNTNGTLRCEVRVVNSESTLSQIIQMVSDAAASKAPIAKIADTVSGIFVPCVISIAIVTFIVWLLLGKSFSFALARGVSVLVISCPCALGLATPVAIMVANGVGAKHGILFKNATALEICGKTQIVALDKTGTITQGNPSVTDIISDNKEELLQYAYTLELESEHPLSKAIVNYSQDNNVSKIDNIENFKAVSGLGLKANINNIEVYGGNLDYIKSIVDVNQNYIDQAYQLAKQGKTVLYFATKDKLLGLIAVADTIRQDSADAIAQLKAMGIKTVMLTGDNLDSANTIGKLAGVDAVIAQVLPNEKKDVIDQLKQQGFVAMVGDGINDAPALTSANIGIAIGAGSDVAIDAGEVVVLKSNLTDVVGAIRLSKACLRNIHENLFWAFIYNIIGIPLAAGVYYHFGLLLNPMFGAAAMSLSSVSVVSNALRLNLFNPYSNKKDKKIESVNLDVSKFVKDKKEEGEKQMEELVLNVKGMMCEHCEAHVKKALEKLDGVESASADHNSGKVVVKVSKKVDEKDFASAIDDAGYELVK